MATKPIPEGYHTLTTYLAVDDAAAAIDFYKQAFGAKELMRMDAPGREDRARGAPDRDSRVMLSDPFPQSQVKPPKELGGCTGGAFMYVETTSTPPSSRRSMRARPVAMEPEDMFWGDRFGSVMDPFGHHWSIATHVEDLTTPRRSPSAARPRWPR